MMPRRRALLANAAINIPQLYNVKIITSLLMHESADTAQYSLWYRGMAYDIDTETGFFVLDNPSSIFLNFQSSDAFRKHLLQKYCILGANSGSPMYYFPAGCTASYEYDESSGIYSITAHGKIQMYTPIISA